MKTWQEPSKSAWWSQWESGDPTFYAYLVGDVQIAAGFAEGHHNRCTSILAGHVQRCVAMSILEIHETPMAKEGLDDLHLTAPHSKMQGNVSILEPNPNP